MSVVGEILFYNLNGPSLDAELRHQAEQVLSGIVDDIPEKELTSLSDAAAVERAARQVRVEPLEILLDKATSSADEAVIDVSGRQDIISFGGRFGPMTGFRVVKTIPFKGDQQLWFLRPNSFDLNPPRGEVSGNFIMIGIEVLERELEQAKSYIDGEVTKINKYIAAQRPSIDQHNAVVSGLAAMLLQRRRERLNKAAEFLKKL
jgi:hypothetical protein